MNSQNAPNEGQGEKVDREGLIRRFIAFLDRHKYHTCESIILFTDEVVDTEVVKTAQDVLSYFDLKGYLRDGLNKAMVLGQFEEDLGISDTDQTCMVGAHDETLVHGGASTSVQEEQLDLKKIGPYQVEQELGRGAFGVVYLCLHVGEGEGSGLLRRDAVKVLRNHKEEGGKDAFKRFKQEGAAGASVTSPHVVRIHHSNFEHDPPFFAMEYVRGFSLYEAFDRLQDDFIDRLRLVLGVARGAEAFHQQNLVHRDIKPENVLVEEDTFRSVLTDSGMVGHSEGKDVRRSISTRLAVVGVEGDKEKSSINEQGMIIGTPRYMAPEQASGASASKPADVYALGRLLFEAVVGQPLQPFEKGSTLLNVLSSVSKGVGVEEALREKFFNSIPKGFAPDRLLAIALKSLRLDPKERFQDAGQMVEELEGYIHEVTKTLEQRRADEHRAYVRAKRKFQATVLVCVVLFTVGGSFLYNIDQESRRAQQEVTLTRQKLEAEEKAKLEERKRARLESEARTKIEQLLKLAVGMNTASDLVEAWRWSEALEVLDDLIVLSPNLHRLHKLRARCLLNLNHERAVEEFLWLAKSSKPEKSMRNEDWVKKQDEYTLLAAYSLVVFGGKPKAKRVGELKLIVSEIKGETPKKIGYLLLLSFERKVAIEASDKDSAQEKEQGVKDIVLNLYQQTPSSAIACYILALELEPFFSERTRSIELYSSAFTLSPEFLPALRARQRNSRFVVNELGVDTPRSAIRIKSAQDDLTILRKRLRSDWSLDLDMIDCLVTKSRMKNYRYERSFLVEKALSIARGLSAEEGQAILDGDIPLNLALATAYAAKYQFVTEKNEVGKEAFQNAGKEALARVLSAKVELTDPVEKRHWQARIDLIQSWLSQ